MARFRVIRDAALRAVARPVIRPLEEEIRTLRDQATIDPLTGLGNRRAFNEAIREEESRIKTTLNDERRSSRHNDDMAVLFIDLNDLKKINDSRQKHDDGDKILAGAAKRIKSALREEDKVFRIGGDEFVVIAIGGSSLNVSEIAKKIIERLNEPAQHIPDMQPIGIGASIGFATYRETGDVRTLVALADKRMYEAKSRK